jgi:hypothetical protein
MASGLLDVGVVLARLDLDVPEGGENVGMDGVVAFFDHPGEESDEREGVGRREIGLEHGGDGLKADIRILGEMAKKRRHDRDQPIVARAKASVENHRLTTSHDFRDSFPTMTAMMLSRKLKCVKLESRSHMHFNERLPKGVLSTSRMTEPQNRLQVNIKPERKGVSAEGKLS